MKKILLVTTLLMSTLAVSAQNTEALLRSYFNLKDAMVNSDGRSATTAVNRLYEAIKNDAPFPQKDALLKATETVKNASSLDKKRAVFNELSTTLWAVVKTTNKLKQPVYYQYCPMKKAYWLSTEKAIRNPYYGASMLDCGKVVETK
jgi:hypothetical protein